MRVATYNRISKREKSRDNNALIRQQWETARAAAMSSQDFRSFTDEQTGTDDERPGFQELLQLVNARQLDVIVVAKIDRITRDAETNARLAKQFEKNNVKIYEILLGRLLDWNNPSDWSYFVSSGVKAEEEIRRNSMRIKLAFDWKREQGKPAGGGTPFGMRRNSEGFYEIDPDTVDAAVELIKAIIDCGGTTAAAVTRARELGIVTITTRPGLYGWIRNLTIRGNTIHQGKVIPGTHASIFDDPRLVEIDAERKIDQLIIDSPRLRGGNRNHRLYPLSGLVFCSRCGGTCHIKTMKSNRYPDKSYTYICCGSRQSKAEDCGGQYGAYMGRRGSINTPYSLAESIVIHALIASAEDLIARAADIAPPPTTQELEPPEAKKLRAQIAQYEALNDPDLSEVIQAKWAQLRAINSNTQTVTAEQRRKQKELVEYFASPLFWELASDIQKKELFRDFVERVDCDKSNVIVKLRV